MSPTQAATPSWNHSGANSGSRNASSWKQWNTSCAMAERIVESFARANLGPTWMRHVEPSTGVPSASLLSSPRAWSVEAKPSPTMASIDRTVTLADRR